MSQVRTSTLRVPGARLHYETCGVGPVLLLIPGGPEDAALFAGVREVLAESYTVVTYDPRGLSSSPLDGDDTSDTSVQTLADDAHRLLAAVGTEPAYVFGESGGAVVGLDLVSRYPERVRRMVAHEPPSIRMLDDAEPHITAVRKVHDVYRSDGIGAAMEEFLAAAGFGQVEPQAGFDPTAAPQKPDEPKLAVRNLERFIGHMLLPTVDQYVPHVATLRTRPVTVTVGEDSVGQLPYRTATALAARLGIEPVVFPGDHFGVEGKPEAFAERLRQVLGGY